MQRPVPSTASWQRGRATGAGAALLALVLWPLTWPLARDSYPLSNYPMFSIARHARRMSVEHVLAVSANGQRMIVPLQLVASNNVMHVAMTVGRAAQGPDSAQQLCEEIAARVAHAGGRLGSAAVIEVVSSTFDGLAYFEGQREPLQRDVRARSPVPQE